MKNLNHPLIWVFGFLSCLFGFIAIKQSEEMKDKDSTIRAQGVELYLQKSELKDYGKYTESFPIDDSSCRMRDYQLDVHMTTIDVYEDARLVGTLKYDSSSALDRMIDEDNQ